MTIMAAILPLNEWPLIHQIIFVANGMFGCIQIW